MSASRRGKAEASAGGKRRPGRPKGSKNKFSVAAARKAAADQGQLPHEYLFSLGLSGDLSPGQRIAALKAAAPYYAPKLSSIEAKLEPVRVELTDSELSARIEALQKALRGEADGPGIESETA
ncbi:MAG: hypothetical protein AB2565_03880 [Candidatus Thiodiazotropha endolucinida]|uniref:Uncharacterized protein n=1 Tax=Candidatus Thiodiazotropha endolucinida TaxID=1655433 RepID=A0A7Z1AFZ7_9GAMM|nr:hypothetical protein [Candidatus Thiodiazotropha endolucinida]ODJ88481.1 hypothetical protein CODIS_14910 [Candidatus Thiodiazotropha endolucinida]